MTQKICSHCKKEFKSSPKNRIYCSDQCYNKNRKSYKKKYFQSDKGKAALKKYFQSDKGKMALKEYSLKPGTKEKRKEYKKKWLSKPGIKEKIKESQKKWLSKPVTKEKMKESQKKWLLEPVANGGALTNYEKRLLDRKGQKNRQYNKKYFSTDKGRKKRVENMTSYYKANPHARFILAVRKRISGFMQIKKMTKRNKTFQMLGCTPQELILHIEKQFKPGMNWNNWSVHGWHLDHIVPLDSGKNQEEVEKLCHYTNLQPLWAEENLKKSNK